jgi:hypothetical protein
VDGGETAVAPRKKQITSFHPTVGRSRCRANERNMSGASGVGGEIGPVGIGGRFALGNRGGTEAHSRFLASLGMTNRRELLKARGLLPLAAVLFLSTTLSFLSSRLERSGREGSAVRPDSSPIPSSAAVSSPALDAQGEQPTPIGDGPAPKTATS